MRAKDGFKLEHKFQLFHSIFYVNFFASTHDADDHVEVDVDVGVHRGIDDYN